jgi:hypothetical protein
MALSTKTERVEFKEAKTKFHIPAALRGAPTVRPRY